MDQSETITYLANRLAAADTERAALARERNELKAELESLRHMKEKEPTCGEPYIIRQAFEAMSVDMPCTCMHMGTGTESVRFIDEKRGYMIAIAAPKKFTATHKVQPPWDRVRVYVELYKSTR